MSKEIDFDIINNFDMPFHNPFKRKSESQFHFIHRCDISMSGLKRIFKNKYGGGQISRSWREEQKQSGNAKTGKKFCGNE